ncbi:hypothetical protein IAQ67_15165 [Paenibacillus peoriae]|uniref:Uncharacterized protein n=1 Tax=Paenibacillus peoriae TaxID=59893 RepID=A0A7H0Y2E3_9BACL|nr:hypothetical protein [Paenibacillus peoriae]QNR65251.1 hypothetical protein IAQ67_15165 [Paenibacillus peoriae]
MNQSIKYPISLSGVVFYWENDRYYELFENGVREEMTREVFESRSTEYNQNGTPIMIIDDKQIDLLLQIWSQAPYKIEKERLQFYFDFSIITLEEYNHFNSLRKDS